MHHKTKAILFFTFLPIFSFAATPVQANESAEDVIYEVKEDCAGGNISGGKCRDACTDLLWSGSVSATSDETNKCIEAFCSRSTDNSEKYCAKFCEKIGDAHPRCVEDYLNKYCQGNNHQDIKCERYCSKISNKHALCKVYIKPAESKAAAASTTGAAKAEVKKDKVKTEEKADEIKKEKSVEEEKKEESKLEKILPSDKEIIEKIKSFFQNWKWSFWRKE